MYRMSPTELAHYQFSALQQLVDFAWKKGPFYAELYKTRPSLLSDMSSFYRLPTINKQIMMDHFDDLNTCGLKKAEALQFALDQEFSGNYSGYFKKDYVVGLSSGTSGNKGIFITQREMTQRLPFVFLARGGIPLSYLPFRILFLLRVFSQGFSDINSPLVKLVYKSTMTPPAELVAVINEQRLDIIMAPPSMLRQLLVQAHKIRPRIKIIISYAEVLEKEEKARIEKAFRCRVHEIYQASEGQIGSTCRCGNLHINEDLVLVELYDAHGNTVDKPGELADRMLVTNLVNRVQPLIRYEMNDLIVLGDKCPCGSAFRVIAGILGRHDDVLYLKTVGGETRPVFPDLFARWIITTDDRIREFKVIQKSREELDIHLDLYSKASDQLNEEEIMLRLNEKIQMELGKFDIKSRITISCGTISLPREMSKYKRFESAGNWHENDKT
jgi:putative adenylate-forming enzyme